MGRMISKFQLQQEYVSNLVIFCGDKEVNDNEISLNNELANKLLAIKESKRALKMQDLIYEIVKSHGENIIVRDIDIVFNPAYKIDVLKMFETLYKSIKFSLIWPGTYNECFLIYAEEGYKDYRKYDINNYDITGVY